MIRVLFDAHQLGRNQTGNETYVRELLRHLATDPDIELIAAVERDAPIPSEAVGHVRLRRVPRNGLARLLALAMVTPRERVDLVHSIYFRPPATGRPSVVTIHDISFESHPEFSSRGARLRNKTIIRAGARAASCVVTPTETSRREIIARYGVPEDRVVAIPNGVSPAFEPPVHREPYDGRRPYRVLAVGSLEPRKNLLRLLEASRSIARDVQIHVRIIGPSGFLGEAIRDRLTSGIQVDVLGWVAEKELVREYQQADVFAFPSLYEGFGFPVVEAMACGTPVVSSNAASLPEVAGDAAILFDPLDVSSMAAALRRTLESRDVREDLSARGLARAKSFSWVESAKRHVAVYCRVLGQ